MRKCPEFCVLIVLLLLPGCARLSPTTVGTVSPVVPTTAAATDEAASGGALVVGLAGPVLTFDPADQRDPATQLVLRNLYDGLVAASPSGELVPELAESITLLDNLTWEFQLRPGVTFHNGDPLTAEDVQFTFERIIAAHGIAGPPPHASLWREAFAPLASVESVDDLTVRFHLAAPWPAGRQLLAYQGILPVDYYRQVGAEGFLAQPVGTGPFHFIGVEPDGTVTLERYADYYGGAPAIPPVGLAPLEQIIFRPLLDDAERVQALLTDEVQVAQNIPPHLVPQLTGSMDWASKPVSPCGGFYDWEPTLEPSGEEITVVPVPGLRPVWLALNLSRPPLDDVRVRRALNYAIRRDHLIEYAAYGRGEPLAGPLSPFNHFADPALAPFDYDPYQAQTLLDAAGLSPADLVLMIETTAKDETIAVGLARQLRRLELPVEVRVWDDEAALKDALDAGGWTAAVRGAEDSGFDAAGLLGDHWGTGGAANVSGYSNSQVDALLDTAMIEADESERHALYSRAQQLIHADAPAVFLFVPLVAEACTGGVHNWTPSPDGLIGLHDVWLGFGPSETFLPARETPSAVVGGNPELLVSAVWLADHLSDPDVRIVDLRPQADYRAGHIPNAVQLDLSQVRAEAAGVSGQAAPPEVIAGVLGKAGVAAGSTVIVYDGGDSRDAARLFWTLEYYGHADVRLLDGGFGVWQAAGESVSVEAAVPGGAGAPATAPEVFTPSPDATRLATAGEVLAALDDGAAVLLDTRSDDEFNGLDVRAARGGHIPGAVHVEWLRNLNTNLTLRPAAELQAMYAAAGVTPDKNIIVYCQTGHRASLTYFVLRWLGYPSVQLYDGSWTEWGNDLTLPIEP